MSPYNGFQINAVFSILTDESFVDKEQEVINITIIGFGHVGSTLTYHLMNTSGTLCINVIEPDAEKEGAFLDLLHASSLYPEKEFHINEQELFSAADFVFYTAGHPNKHGQSRLDKARENIRLTEQIFKGIAWERDPFVIVITNPVDIIAFATQRCTGLAASRVVGTGTFLDSVRLSYYLSTLSGIPASEIDALVIGEHGDSQYAAYSLSRVNGVPIREHEAFSDELLDKAQELTRNAAFQIRETQEATIFGVVKCAVELFNCLQSDKEVHMSLSTLSSPYYNELLGLESSIYIGLPVVVSSSAVRVREFGFTNEEHESLKRSAALLAKISRNN